MRSNETGSKESEEKYTGTYGTDSGLDGILLLFCMPLLMILTQSERIS